MYKPDSSKNLECVSEPLSLNGALSVLINSFSDQHLQNYTVSGHEDRLVLNSENLGLGNYNESRRRYTKLSEIKDSAIRWVTDKLGKEDGLEKLIFNMEIRAPFGFKKDIYMNDPERYNKNEISLYMKTISTEQKERPVRVLVSHDYPLDIEQGALKKEYIIDFKMYWKWRQFVKRSLLDIMPQCEFRKARETEIYENGALLRRKEKVTQKVLTIEEMF